MLFEELLIHSCELVLPSKSNEEDGWGRPVEKWSDPINVNCRYMTKNVYVRDASGAERIIEMSLFLESSTPVDPEMTVQNIKDDKGILLTPTQLKVHSINRHYDDKTLHHYKVFLKGAE